MHQCTGVMESSTMVCVMDSLYYALPCQPFNILMSCSVPADARSSDPAVARQGIRQMKDVLHPFVSALGSSHEAYISSTRLQFGVPHLTLADLPSETILHILGYTDDSQKAASLIRYSHISSKIRNTILDSATIPLHLKMPVHIIETVANRGTAFGLTVDICFPSHEPNHYSLENPTSNPMLISLLKLIEYHHRWKDVKLTINGRPAAKYIVEQFPCNYASIRRLNINISYFGMGPNGDFFRNWTMPHLEKLFWQGIDSVPPPLVNSQALRSFCLDVNNAKATDILTFLTSTPSLTSLDLVSSTLVCFGSIEPEEDPVVNLPKLQDLHLFLSDAPYMETGGASPRLLKAILCPSLKRLSYIPSSRADYENLAQHMQDHYLLLTSFRLDIGWSSAGTEDVVVADIIQLLPSTIEKVELVDELRGAELISSRPGTYDNVPQPLRTSYHLKDLDLRRCFQPLCADFYAGLSTVLGTFGVKLQYFEPCQLRKGTSGDESISKDEREKAIQTLRDAGILVAPRSTS